GGTAGDYTSSNGTLLWDADLNASYHNNVTGIGRDDDSQLSQQKSLTTNDGGMIIMDKGSPFPNNNDFILWGNDDATTTVSTSGAHPSYQYILDRKWKATVKGTPGNVSVSFIYPNNGNPADYALLLDPTNNDFTSGATAHTTGASINGNTITFTGVALTDGMFFTLATNYTRPSPGGISDDLAIWLKADAGTSTSIDGNQISTWNDQSGNGNSLSQATANKQPTYQSNDSEDINNNPVIKFDGTDDVMSDPTGILGNNTYNDANIYIVSTVNSINNSFAFFEQCSPSRFSAHIPWGNQNIYFDAGNSNGNSRLSGNWGGKASTPYLWSMLYSTTSSQTIPSNRQIITKNGLSIAADNTASTYTGTNQPFYLGGVNATPGNP
ncbi:MAG: hypothetical protein GY810_11170, partial [Aureispira sp.]|nr:hypothetical protein [Aureispira sp.]